MSVSLDSLDTRILDALQRDATEPINDLAERLASSKSVVWRRIQRLIDAGVIRERVAILDPKKVGLEVLVFAQVKMSRHGRDVLPKFVEAVRHFPQVVECHSLMGSVDFLLKILVRDVKDYESFFWNQLSKIDGVQEISSSISMTQFFSTTRIPVQTGAGGKD
ncbi:Lrp/AsnC family transcriptional regulator [Stagnimonas aquatica]|jgi:Lrp/AsnC family transcriptional regulator|uniref:Lrp/AsnC family transcriptional regulator n=1 Tax=Stagnimonas aquatica TaxID=2689987 RepID=A0A3N0UZI7_9GAMM|nr:Lrp/AsnC family transcriptional regulator [Stagnimonas aquatica]ROH85648.1 Lrp/AsnC family transcriptional regulator [Stagnimonas aquatica]